jgi:hypothetical protein
LVEWKDYPNDEASWEREVNLKKDSPTFVTEDDDIFLRGKDCDISILKYLLLDYAREKKT